MHLLQRITEKNIKPVRVRHFILLQESVLRLSCILQAELPARFIVHGNHIRHLLVNTAIFLPGHVRIIQPPFLLHLLVHHHLLLRVHQIILLVIRLHPYRELPTIIHLHRSLLPSFRRDHHHAVHRPRPVQRCRRSILQYLETLDIVGIQTRYG